MNTTTTLFAFARVAGPWLRARLAAAFDPCRTPAPVPIPARRPQPRATLALLLGLALVPAAFGAADARALRTNDSNWLTSVQGQLVDVQVQVNGSTAPLYQKSAGWSPWNRDDRFYFEAFRGAAYSLRLRNHTGRRVGVVLSVDGLNVVSGDRSRLSRNEPMYVLDPWEAATIRGWRTSLDEVRQFRFVDEQRSYAERTGQANGDMGWVRVAAFTETGPAVRYRDDRRDNGLPYGAEPAPQGSPQGGLDKGGAERRGMSPESAPQADNYPGTGWGERKHDPVNETDFVAARTPADQLVLRYEYAAGLRALGIEPVRDDDRLRDRERGELGFARPPRW